METDSALTEAIRREYKSLNEALRAIDQIDGCVQFVGIKIDGAGEIRLPRISLRRAIANQVSDCRQILNRYGVQP